MPRHVAFLLMFAPISALGQTMDHHAMMMPHPSGGAASTQVGQSAFAAIEEMVDLLEADPKTDWSKVDIEALRRHLIDMDNVTLHAEVKSVAVDGGMKFIVTGTGDVRDSIRRMTAAHADAMNASGGWRFSAVDTEEGADMTVLAPPRDLIKLRALGFIGVLTRGMHHQMHHGMIARGELAH